VRDCRVEVDQGGKPTRRDGHHTRGKKGYVANANSGFVTSVRIATNTALGRVRFSAPGGGADAVVVSPDGRYAYAAGVTTHGRGSILRGRVLPIRTATDRPLRPIRTGHYLIGMTITPDGKTIYALDWLGGPGAVIPIRTATNKALRPIKAGPIDDEDSITITRDGRTVMSPTSTLAR
jgi:DNA-binding beta-propeller fold protein YncE